MLNKHNFSIAEVCEKSKLPSRFSILGLNVEANQTVATDGHILVIMSGTGDSPEDFPVTEGITPTHSFEPFQVSKADALEIAKSAYKNFGVNKIFDCIAVEPNCTQVKIGVNNLARQSVKQFEKVPGNFPNYRMVRKEKAEYKTAISFDAKLMISLLKALMPIADEKQPSVTLRIDEPDMAMRIDAVPSTESSQTAESYLMPCRLHEQDNAEKGSSRKLPFFVLFLT